MDASSIAAADSQVLENLGRCPQLTTAQRLALNSLLAAGNTSLGPPGSWDLEGLQALGPLATYINPHLWMQVPEPAWVEGSPECGSQPGPKGIVGQGPQRYQQAARQAASLDFFRSVVAKCREGQLSQHKARRFVTSFLESKAMPVSTRPKRDTGRTCVCGEVTAAALRDDLFLVRYNCTQLESCLGSGVLRAHLDPLLQQPLPAECQRVVKTKLAQVYPGGIPEDQLRSITSLVYLYSPAEISQWNITSGATVLALLASDVALENQTEAILQKFLDHNGTVTGALLVAIGGSRLCWMSPRQIQAIQPSELRLAGALDVSRCPQSHKNLLFAKAREAFGSMRTSAAYYHSMRPYLGGAPVEELQHLAQANVSMDIDTFTNLNPRVLQSLSVSHVTTLLGQNVVDLQKARSHPAIRSWLGSLNSSALYKLGLALGTDSLKGSTGTAYGLPDTTSSAHHSSGLLGSHTAAPTSGSPPACLGRLLLAAALPSGFLWLLWLGAYSTHNAASMVHPEEHLRGGAEPGRAQPWVPPTPCLEVLEG
ncbi:mesothelin-like protein [Ochotona princeps]|uniref:mesothelin-like protein n=1 Tax=Ochotona princeps TaxID=9978 RepID=UPI00271482F3|nr:mesothelin-like protein [Ochotona princeps]